MKRTIRTIIIISLLQAMQLPAFADQTAEELASEFLALARLDERRTQMIEIMVANLKEASKQDPTLADAELSEAERAELFGVMQEEIEAFAQDLAPPLKASMIAFYVERFSKEELQDLIAIYKSPVFVKQFDVLPDLMEQNAAITRKKLGAVQQRVFRRVEAWMEEKRGE